MLARSILWSMTAIVLFGLIGCGGDESASAPTASIQSNKSNSGGSNSNSGVDPVRLTTEDAGSQSPAAPQIEMFPEVLIKTSVGDIRLRLNWEKSTRTVENFLTNYVERGAYDNTIIHYVESDFMIAAGGYDADREPITTRSAIFNEADNGLSNVRGTVAMAHHADYVHSATSQFFINLSDNSSLDYEEQEDGHINGYCVFGEVVEGMDVVDKIAAAQTHDIENFPSTPQETVVIESVRRVK